MVPEHGLLEVLIAITDIANNRTPAFEQKLRMILQQIVGCMQAKKASIMLLKRKGTLEVVASTNPAIIGVRQSLEDSSPSSWVFRHQQPLYADSSCACSVPTGRYKHYQGDAFYLVPLMINGKVIGVVSVTEKINADCFEQGERDILLRIMGHVIIALENHRLAESLHKKHRALQKKNQELRKLERLRTDLFNMLIHDLKGPISDIVANLDLLAYTLGGESLEHVEIAMSGCSTLYNMISNQLDIARLEEGKLALFHEAIDPRELVKESLARLLFSGRSKNVRFAEQYPAASQGLACTGDRALLLRVLQNLLTNAVHYSPRDETITVGFHQAPDRSIEFYVQDNGPGVPDNRKATVFDKYVQLNERSEDRIDTAGLGLAFCKIAVEAHCGSIGVESDGARGSRFFFRLPLAKD